LADFHVFQDVDPSEKAGHSCEKVYLKVRVGIVRKVGYEKAN